MIQSIRCHFHSMNTAEVENNIKRKIVSQKNFWSLTFLPNNSGLDLMLRQLILTFISSVITNFDKKIYPIVGFTVISFAILFYVEGSFLLHFELSPDYKILMERKIEFQLVNQDCQVFGICNQMQRYAIHPYFGNFLAM